MRLTGALLFASHGIDSFSAPCAAAYAGNEHVFNAGASSEIMAIENPARVTNSF